METEKRFLQCLRRKRWTEFLSGCLENCDCKVRNSSKEQFEDSLPIIHASIGVQNVSIFQYTRVSATSLCTILYEILEEIYQTKHLLKCSQNIAKNANSFDDCQPSLSHVHMGES